MPNLKSELEMLANYREDNIPSPAIQFMHFHARRALEALKSGMKYRSVAEQELLARNARHKS